MTPPEGFQLLCGDPMNKVYLFQKGKQFQVSSDTEGTRVSTVIEERTQQEGFEKAEVLYYETIKEK